MTEVKQHIYMPFRDPVTNVAWFMIAWQPICRILLIDQALDNLYAALRERPGDGLRENARGVDEGLRDMRLRTGYDGCAR